VVNFVCIPFKDLIDDHPLVSPTIMIVFSAELLKGEYYINANNRKISTVRFCYSDPVFHVFWSPLSFFDKKE